MRKFVAVVVLVVGILAFPAAALAAPPDDPSCWGQAARGLAQSAVGAMGEHASSFDSPRLGIGNVAYLFTGTHQPSELAGLLGGPC
jgi:hypothetical protein